MARIAAALRLGSQDLLAAFRAPREAVRNALLYSTLSPLALAIAKRVNTVESLILSPFRLLFKCY